MKIILIIFVVYLIQLKSYSQCSFEILSNDTIYQDYIELIHSKKNSDEIITIGSRINRGIISSEIFNAPLFKSYDYCGNILTDTFYLFFNSIKLSHRPLATHYTYKNEPIGNKAIAISDNEFLIVDNGQDTLTNELKLVLFRINAKGKLLGINTLNLNDLQANHKTIKHVIKLKDDKLLVILWDYFNEYTFFYFDVNYNLLYSKDFTLPRGIRSLQEINNGEFICTTLAYDSLTFQFYKLDTNGLINWITNPYNINGSASEIQILNNKLYITGGANQINKGNFGAFIICDLNGNILRQFKFDTIGNNMRLCSAFIESENEFILGGYIYNNVENNAEDILIFKIDSTGQINWLNLYNFKSGIGTSGPRGYFKDYGGFGITKTNDGGIVTYGSSQYRSNINGVPLHDDATLIKTKPILISSNKNNKTIQNEFYLNSNLISSELNLNGSTHHIKSWSIYTLQGVEIFKGNNWLNPINIEALLPQIYVLTIADKFNNNYSISFLKK